MGLGRLGVERSYPGVSRQEAGALQAAGTAYAKALHMGSTARSVGPRFLLEVRVLGPQDPFDKHFSSLTHPQSE